jgi:hypothetical protein
MLEKDQFWLSWNVLNLDGGTSLKMAVQVASDGHAQWAAVGFSPHGKMLGSFAVVCSSSNGGSIAEYVCAPTPSLITKVMCRYYLEKQTQTGVQRTKVQSLKNTAISTVSLPDGSRRLICEFEKQTSGGNLGSYIISTSNPTPIIHAWGTDQLSYHKSNKGSDMINFSEGTGTSVADTKLSKCSTLHFDSSDTVMDARIHPHSRVTDAFGMGRLYPNWRGR